MLALCKQPLGVGVAPTNRIAAQEAPHKPCAEGPSCKNPQDLGRHFQTKMPAQIFGENPMLENLQNRLVPELVHELPPRF